MNRGEWIILRTAGRSTLGLARSLSDAGFNVWTPTLSRLVRKRRARVMVESEAPITPTFVFAKFDDLPSLIALASSRIKQQPDFSVMRYYGKYPVITEAALSSLRDVERKATLRAKRVKPGEAEPFAEGDTVRVPNGICAGMSGIVTSSTGKATHLMIGHMPFEIATFHLRADSAYTSAVLPDTAAQAA